MRLSGDNIERAASALKLDDRFEFFTAYREKAHKALFAAINRKCRVGDQRYLWHRLLIYECLYVAHAGLLVVSGEHHKP